MALTALGIFGCRVHEPVHDLGVALRFPVTLGNGVATLSALECPLPPGDVPRGGQTRLGVSRDIAGVSSRGGRPFRAARAAASARSPLLLLALLLRRRQRLSVGAKARSSEPPTGRQFTGAAADLTRESSWRLPSG